MAVRGETQTGHLNVGVARRSWEPNSGGDGADSLGAGETRLSALALATPAGTEAHRVTTSHTDGHLNGSGAQELEAEDGAADSLAAGETPFHSPLRLRPEPKPEEQAYVHGCSPAWLAPDRSRGRSQLTARLPIRANCYSWTSTGPQENPSDPFKSVQTSRGDYVSQSLYIDVRMTNSRGG
ncbi:MAG: hypothetical protein K2X93_03105 [Candidatus Obscuribacterales bacterium]|nr:hypothetical protein [Candidatus Obscuribacterales bacterium]